MLLQFAFSSGLHVQFQSYCSATLSSNMSEKMGSKSERKKKTARSKEEVTAMLAIWADSFIHSQLNRTTRNSKVLVQISEDLIHVGRPAVSVK